MPKAGDTAHTLKFWREVAGLRQRKLADLAGLHYTTISGYETGKKSPQTETVRRVTAALGMTATDREQTESFIRQLRYRITPTQLGDDMDESLPAPLRGISVWKEEAAQVILDGSRFAGRFLHLVIGLLLSIAEVLFEGRDAQPGPPS
jgi:transcriptional regulator with XRE-family HTH domain